MRFLLRSILKSEGHTVLEAEHGEAALAQLTAEPGVALLVTDLEMPVMNGRELLRALSHRSLPKLVVSGCSAEPLLEGLGVDGFFCKPLELARFKSTVSNLLEHTALSG